MKKSAILAFAAAIMLGQNAVAQNNVKEITYVEDATQGYLVNNFSSNWFITLQGGVANSMTKGIARPGVGDRFAPAAGLYVGKYFSPIIGVRAGFDWFQAKGMNDFKLNNLGAAGDVMLNLTNWWCGYNPDRVFNASIYAGLGGYFNTMKVKNEWVNAHHQFLTARAGLLLDFNLSRNFALGLDLRAVGADKSVAELSNNKSVTGEILVSATYKFNKSTWNAPVVAVVPEFEDCEPIKARLQAANARIEDLEAQLKACLNRPVEKVVETSKAPLATIYFTIGNSTLNSVDRKVLGAVAEQIKASGKSYTLTGWADTYTGTDAINARLRVNRAKSVEKALINNGVPASKLTTKSGEGNLNDLGIKYVALDRCVTIEENK
ncbi:MAG: OmpA family protein [Muribaculaceae bacterium]|nr:OmpA family protein [Muribaculaceae bacterium]